MKSYVVNTTGAGTSLREARKLAKKLSTEAPTYRAIIEVVETGETVAKYHMGEEQ